MFRSVKRENGDGVVCAIGKRQVFVAPLSHSTAAALKKNCGSSKPDGCGGGCGRCLPFISDRSGHTGKIRIPVDNGGGFKVGDRVRYTRFIPEPGLMSALLFGLPVVLAIAVIVYQAVASPYSVESLATFFGVVAAFLTGFVIIGITDGIFKKRYPPSILLSRPESDIAGAGAPNANDGSE